jgi:replicative DNA helicase
MTPTKKTNSTLSDYVFGKVPPQAPSLEEAVLGGIMLDKDAMEVVIETLKPDSFYSEAHQAIFKAMVSLFERKNPIDLLTVTEELKKSGDLETAGGPHYLVELTNRVASSANLEYHSRIVAQKAMQREIIRIGTVMIKESYDDSCDIFELIDVNKSMLANVDNVGTAEESLGEVGLAVLKEIEYNTAVSRAGKWVGIPWSITKLNHIIGGRRPGKLYTTLSRPGMGKTAWLCCEVLFAAKHGFKELIFSLEMSKKELLTRIACIHEGLNGEKLVIGKGTDEELKRLAKAIEYISTLPIYIIDIPGISIQRLERIARRYKRSKDIDEIWVDYLQLGSNPEKKSNREQEVSSICRALKGLSKTLDIPVNALGQLNRELEKRGNPRPRLADARETGAIEQDSDMVSFIFRPEYYDILEDEQGNSVVGRAEYFWLKNRGGRNPGSVWCDWIAEYTTFSDENPDNDLFDGPGPQDNIITLPSGGGEDNDDLPF